MKLKQVRFVFKSLFFIKIIADYSSCLFPFPSERSDSQVSGIFSYTGASYTHSIFLVELPQVLI